MKAVNHEELKNVLKICYEQKQPMFIWGAPGIGKSETIKLAAQELSKSLKLEFSEDDIENGKFGFVDVRISQLEACDLRGLPNVSEGKTKWLPPNWLPTKPDSKGILFFDELNLAVPSIQASSYQLILDRRLGDYRLPPGWLIVSAGNRTEDRASVFEMSAPLANRFCHLELSIPIMDKWTDWALLHQIDSRIVAYLQFSPSDLFKFDTKMKDKAYPTPRSFAFCSRLIDGVTNLDMLDTLISSAIGEGTALKIVGFLKLQKKIDLQKVFENPASVKAIEEIDQKYTLMSMITEEFKKSRKHLPKIVEICKYLEPEFAILLLRFIKSVDKDFLKTNINKAPVWKDLQSKYSEILLGGED